MSNFPSLRNRKQLPPFGRLPQRFDIQQLLDAMERLNLTDPNRYNDIRLSEPGPFNGLTQAYRFNIDSFFKGDDEPSLNGERYRLLHLTQIDPKMVRKEIPVTGETQKQRLRRIQANSSLYTPEADDRLYTQRNGIEGGIFDDVLAVFSRSQLLRVRLAYMAPGFAIKPHMDYDCSYITRYHLPLITNDSCRMFVSWRHGNREIVASTHFPADGHLYFFNSGRRHWAVNYGSEPRIHLLIDVHGQAELEDLEELHGTQS